MSGLPLKNLTERLLPDSSQEARVCGRCGRKTQDRNICRRFAHEERIRCPSAAINGTDTAFCDQRGDIRNFFVADGGIGGARDLARRHHVPERDFSPLQEVLFAVNVCGREFPEKGANRLPETILRISVIKTLRAALDGRKAPQNEQFAVGKRERLKPRDKRTHRLKPFSRFPTLETAAREKSNPDAIASDTSL